MSYSSAIAHVKYTGAVGGTSAGVDTTGADLIVVQVIWSLGGGTAIEPTLSDNKSNTWTPLTVQQVANGVCGRILYCQAPTVGSGHTFTLGGSPIAVPALYMAAFSGSTASPADQQNGTHTTSSITSVQPGSITPSQDNCLVVTGLGMAGTSGPAVDSGFTITDSAALAGGVNYGAGLAYLVQGSAAAINPTWSWTGASTQTIATIASFKPAGAAATDVIPLFQQIGGFGGPVGYGLGAT